MITNPLATSKGNTSGKGCKVSSSVFRVLLGAAYATLCSSHNASCLDMCSVPIGVVRVSTKRCNNASLFIGNRARHPRLCKYRQM